MTNVFIADAQPDERSALRLMLVDLKMNIVGEGGSWKTILEKVHDSKPDLVLVDWGLVESESRGIMSELRAICPVTSIIVLFSQWDPREQAALSAGADLFISKAENTRQVAEYLQAAADTVRYKHLLDMI
jgi:DNA-binding NarL/FixJ family response regulator